METKKKFSVADLISKNEKKNISKATINKIFLDSCRKKIETYNQYGHSSLLHEIPPFKIGLPPYNTFEIIENLIKYLKDAGFYVVHIPKTLTIYISWKQDDLNKIKNTNNGFLSISLNKNGFFDNLPINSKNLK